MARGRPNLGGLPASRNRLHKPPPPRFSKSPPPIARIGSCLVHSPIWPGDFSRACRDPLRLGISDEPVRDFLTIARSLHVALKKSCLSFTFPQHPPPSLAPPELHAANMSYRGTNGRGSVSALLSSNLQAPAFCRPIQQSTSPYQYETQLSSTASLLSLMCKIESGVRSEGRIKNSEPVSLHSRSWRALR